ncbi:hypothetical protein E7Z59_04075 [Robertkochia marina]|uniref:50S ribosomal protein L27 n=1 Tax=Robertkochia marina TaxID=1227945 RepID=A0A4S3M2Z5_9FLAO|nr:hypothetical protein [Robertkochia marina]THD69514.1 hypothetical protein E7Z59_04075 [Robertkochia marina]TRZ47227.1 hypothetical protein D3A96_00495 [Robertkochia marina]
MYTYLNVLHSYWAYLTLFILIVAVVNAVSGLSSNKEYTMAKDLRIGLFALIFSHIQLLLGLALYFVTPRFSAWQTGGVMGDSLLRLLLVEHPFTNIIAIALITVGWSKHKKKETSKAKFKSIALFYGIGLALILLRIPYDIWFS